MRSCGVDKGGLRYLCSPGEEPKGRLNLGSDSGNYALSRMLTPGLEGINWQGNHRFHHSGRSMVRMRQQKMAQLHHTTEDLDAPILESRDRHREGEGG